MPSLIEQSAPSSVVQGIFARHSVRTAKDSSIPVAREKSAFSFVDELLAEQQTLTAVARFARKHGRNELPAQARYYRDLIPLAKPQPGEQYAFTVDLDKCSGCKACVSACHSLNGLDDGEMWRSVGLLVGEEADLQFATQRHVTTACHHCVEPGCADGCPVLAYEKDPVTGIVRHLDDQCIGCQYCVMKCPYDVPKYSATKGIVRKCDMCHGRLAAGEAPACVQACPHEAIRIEIVNQSSVRSRFNVGVQTSACSGNTMQREPQPTFLPDSPEPHITLPTTRYISARPLPESLRSADANILRLEPAHWPLVFMLVLTQLAGGLHLLHGILFSAGWMDPLPVLAMFALCTLLVGLTASVAHLGRPLKAWRAFLGWRRSWMSREIIVFSIYTVLAALLVWRSGSAIIAQATALAALLGIACSAMIYVDTKQPAWRANAVFINFFGTMLLLGATAGAVWAGWIAPQLVPTLTILATIIRTGLFAWEWTSLFVAKNNSAAPFHRGALTAFTLLRPVLIARVILFAVSTAFSVFAISNFAQHDLTWAMVVCISTIAAQVLERYTFFAACSPKRMPGTFA